MPSREIIFCQNVFSSWKRRNTPRFRTLLLGKEAVETFFYKCSNSGIYESTPQPITGNKVVGAVMLLTKFLSRKISPEKSLDFLSQKSVLLPALGARVKRRGFSPAAAARHSQSARVHTDLRQKHVSPPKIRVEPALEWKWKLVE